ncbi:HlyD family efflux transporter periplasmic adaptor subunit [Microbacterium terricola]|uniref:HlyD family efflux transporter periplasmic adaptor subunit n=1 Tax=Microbacterium terricola TaxID=344163 RepID=A0ABM8DZM7_9MICO|nr:HlyD family efflux transporter periplasmic adaptor subunit [Microbacterium terricola]UYK41110.1 HlyD family efflux transporter periplasmic adaptor subunit [Microbacterium terricola]BDV31128.1 hypothetical protein Microterr_17880 [Microbacterium terricola]
MTWGARIRLLLGLLVVFAIVAACTLVFTQRQSRAESRSASITAESFTVGSAYPGTVTTMDAAVGDEVEEGETLFEVRSPQLARDLESDVVTADDLGMPVDDDGTYAIVSTVDGTLSEVLAPVGDFVQGGEVLATINRAGTLAVAAEFVLTPRDYGRIGEGSSVEVSLPDDQVVTGTVSTIDVDTVDGQASSTIVIDSKALAAEPIGGLYQPGTPVTATLQLRDDGPLAGAADAARDFLRKVGW